MPSAKSKSRRNVAYHEAGHAVVALWLRRRAGTISIEADDAKGSAGHVCLPPIKSFSEWEFEPEKYRRFIEREILIALAGPEAEFILTGRRNLVGAGATPTTINGRRVRFLDGRGDFTWALRAAEVVAFDS